ncbi:MAG TPA: DUF438 domain-containing protein [Planctomycetes bacterium]|nr:DUF438 domain-containing protein [Planctomycetota bacterium]HIJ70295.1 DUF438 domain-containing protein [Planctomycetota bacterium]
MGKIYEKDDNAEILTRLLMRINAGEDLKDLRKEAGRLIVNLTSSDIAAAEQNLIDSGCSARVAGQLSAAFVVIGIIEGRRINLRTQLPNNHIVRKVLVEHEMLLCFLADLKELADVIKQQSELSSANSDFRKLAHIAQHLEAMVQHIEVEEDIIFPYLQKHGWINLCRAAHSEHIYVKIAIDDLMKIVRSFNPQCLDEFKVRLNSLTKYLCQNLQEHIIQEDNILYPIAVEVIRDPNVWDRIKALCDEIGYCPLHI